MNQKTMLIGTILAITAISIPMVISETSPKPQIPNCELPENVTEEQIELLIEIGCNIDTSPDFPNNIQAQPYDLEEDLCIGRNVDENCVRISENKFEITDEELCGKDAIVVNGICEIPKHLQTCTIFEILQGRTVCINYFEGLSVVILLVSSVIAIVVFVIWRKRKHE